MRDDDAAQVCAIGRRGHSTGAARAVCARGILWRTGGRFVAAIPVDRLARLGNFRIYGPHPDGPARQAALFDRSDNLNAEAIGSRNAFDNNQLFIGLSESAQGLFVEWYTTFMRERRAVESSGGESAPIAAHFGKCPGLLGKLALILHVADDPNEREVSDRTLLKALAWIEYLIPHAC